MSHSIIDKGKKILTKPKLFKNQVKLLYESEYLNLCTSGSLSHCEPVSFESIMAFFFCFCVQYYLKYSLIFLKPFSGFSSAQMVIMELNLNYKFQLLCDIVKVMNMDNVCFIASFTNFNRVYVNTKTLLYKSIRVVVLVGN